jgi:UMF1 family MFS transporter
MADTDETDADDAVQTSPLRVGSWVLYDLANTVYIATVTFVFTPYAKEVLGGLSGHGITNFLSMVAAGLLVPFFGALVDTTGRTSRYLIVTTGLCITALAGWSLDWGGGWLLLCFFAANLCYNLALLFYNALLTSVAPPERAGRVSGLGVGVGYLGTILVLVSLLTLPAGERSFFLIAAAMFAVLALPCLLFVRERRAAPRVGGPLGPILREANGRLFETVRTLPRHPALMWFLIGNFFLVDVLNTAVLYFADFTKDVFAAKAETGVDLFGATFQGEAGIDEFMQIAGLCLNVIAMLVGISIGRWTDRAPLAVLRVSAVGLLFALAGGAWFGGVSPIGYLCTLVALGAFGLTGIWTAGRKVVVLLAPPDKIGQYFGLYGITVKLSVIGGVVYGLVHDEFGSKPAMLAQSSQLLLGLLCLLMVRLPSNRVAAAQ